MHEEAPAGKEAAAPSEEIKGTYREFLEPYLEFAETLPDSPWYRVRCPFHDDSTPSAGVSRTTGTFNCFVCGTFSPVELLERLTGGSKGEILPALESFRQESKLVYHDDSHFSFTPPLPQPKLTLLYEESKLLLTEDNPLVRWYDDARGIHYSTLSRYGVGFLPIEKAPDHFLRDCLTFPYYYNGKITGLRLRDEAGSKSAPKKSYFTLYGTEHLPETYYDTCILMEGETDTLRLCQALDDLLGPHTPDNEERNRYHVVGTPTALFKREWLREIADARTLLYIPQGDEAAQKMLKQVQQAREDTVILELPWRRYQHGNDLADWLRYHKDSHILDRLNQAIPSRRKKIFTGAEFESEANHPRKWLINNLVSRQQLMIIAGQPKGKKTWVMFNLVRTLLTSETFLGLPGMQVAEEVRPLNCLIIEEEGPIQELYERAEMVLGDIPDWKERTFWGHRIGLQFDNDSTMPLLKQAITQHSIDVLAVDPFSRTYSVDEDKSQEMAPVLARIQSLLTEFPHLTIVLIHHFTKSATIADKLKGFRGSSKIAGEVDIAVFVEALPIKEGFGIKVCFDGRSIKTPTDKNGSEYFKIDFEEGLLTVRNHQVAAAAFGEYADYLFTKNGHTATLGKMAKDLRRGESTAKKHLKDAQDKDGNQYFKITTDPVNAVIQWVTMTDALIRAMGGNPLPAD